MFDMFEVTLRDKCTGYTRTLLYRALGFHSAIHLAGRDFDYNDEEIIKIEKDYDEHAKGETAKYTVEMVLSTTDGELPDHADVEKLVIDQMSGELDETTGLFCISVHLKKYSCDIE